MDLSTVKKIIAGLFLGVFGLTITAGGLLTYYLHQSSPLMLIVDMKSEELPGLIRWSAAQGFFAFHPTDQEVEALNAEAGARYSATFPDRKRAEELLQHMLDHGVDINSIDTASGSGVTALHSAALQNDVDAVKLLLANGANPKAEDAKGRTPLGYLREVQEPDTKFKEVKEVLKEATQS